MTQVLNVPDMTCGHCKVEQALLKLPGVERATVDLDTKTVAVDHVAGVSSDALRAADFRRRLFSFGGRGLKGTLLIGVVALAMIATACGGGGGSTSDTGGNSEGHGGHGSMEGNVMGEAVDSDAERTVEVVMLDELAYDPEELQVDEGEVITFEVVNDGKTRHEFVLGDEDYQRMHEGEMQDGDHGEDMGNALSLEPGEEGSVTWRFTEAGEVLYGCHEPGHYEGGMVGTIQVS